MKDASCIIPVFNLSFMASSCFCSSLQISLSTPLSTRRALNFHIVVESGTTYVVLKNVLNEMDQSILFQAVHLKGCKAAE